MSSFGSCLREDEINELSTFSNGCFDDMENHSNKVVQQSTEDLLELTTLLDDFIDSISENDSNSHIVNCDTISSVDENRNATALSLKTPVAKSLNKFVSKPVRSTHRSRETKSNLAKIKVSTERRLIVFPTFLKCDSMFYFPHSMTRMLNNGDRDALRQLTRSHLSPDCSVYFCGVRDMNVSKMCDVMDASSIVHPDCMQFVHNVVVQENTITATIYFKLTDSRALVETAQKTMNLSSNVHSSLRSNLIKSLAERSSRTAEDTELINLLSSFEELEIYGKVDMKLSVNDDSKKVDKFSYHCNLSSVRYSSKSYAL